MSDLLYKSESYYIIGAAMKVYNALGHGFLESVYQEALELELSNQNIPFEREKDIHIFYGDTLLKTQFRVDFICYDKIIVELKAVSDIVDSNRAQLFNYLKATNYRLGLLVNFGHYGFLQHERIVM